MEPTSEQTDVTEHEAETAETVELTELVEEDLVVEEVSIDGMCGVY